VARCYAALALGASKDSRALAPLNETLTAVDEVEEKEYLASYAAMALGLLCDHNAVDSLIVSLGDPRRQVRGCAAYALGRIGDTRAIRPLVEAFGSGDRSMDLALHRALQKIAKIKLGKSSLGQQRELVIKEYPKLGDMEWESYERVWRHWLIIGGELAKEGFERHYGILRRIRTEQSEEHGLVDYELQKMRERIGIAALPFLIEKVRTNDIALIPSISILTNSELEKTATATECLKWWDANRHKWSIPFGEL
jgi:hypothetical protein